MVASGVHSSLGRRQTLFQTSTLSRALSVFSFSFRLRRFFVLTRSRSIAPGHLRLRVRPEKRHKTALARLEGQRYPAVSATGLSTHPVAVSWSRALSLQSGEPVATKASPAAVSPPQHKVASRRNLRSTVALLRRLRRPNLVRRPLRQTQAWQVSAWARLASR